ncbi:MAG: hypothetical protein K6E35_08790 [Bacteroidales bacterium]|nr:hypothetical protein [Bacteroidales bacterium]
MSKITLNAVLTLLRFALNLIPKIARAIYSIIDLCDDGCINASVQRPAWIADLEKAIDILTGVGSDLTQLESELNQS